MFANDHNPPHFYIYGFDGNDAQVRLGVWTVINGKVDRRALKEAIAWAKENADLLEETWNDFQKP
jgi:Domain of unknown function (DUF4160)